MILVVDALNKHRFVSVLDDMFKLRARVFQDRMGWDVTVRNDREIDTFDELDPAYIICLDEEYEVVGCARLLQTTGPHMLSDVFYEILDGEPPLRSATIWESTRFCVDRDRLGKGTGRNSVSNASCELMIGIIEYAIESGISDVITVMDPVMDRIMKRSGNAPYGYVGKTVEMGKVKALAALGDCTQERINNVREVAGIKGNIFLTETEVLEGRAPADVASLSDDLRSYCDDQILTATSQHERAAAMALQQALTGMLRSRRNCDA